MTAVNTMMLQVVAAPFLVRIAKAAEDSRTPGRVRDYRGNMQFRQVLECGSPLPLWLPAGLTFD